MSTKFGIGGLLADLINCADFFVDRFRGIDFVGSSVLRYFGMYPAMGVALYRRGAMDNLAR